MVKTGCRIDKGILKKRAADCNRTARCYECACFAALSGLMLLQMALSLQPANALEHCSAGQHCSLSNPLRPSYDIRIRHETMESDATDGRGRLVADWARACKSCPGRHHHPPSKCSVHRRR